MSSVEVEKQNKAKSYYDKFSRVYDFVSPKVYYHKARTRAIKELRLSRGQAVLNVPVGTGQNFEYLHQYLSNSGLIIGLDISQGILSKAQDKADRYQWHNIKLLNEDVTQLDDGSIREMLARNGFEGFDAILCDLGLSGFPHWQTVIDLLLSLLMADGRIAIMDWYIERPSWRGSFIRWIGKGEVDRPIWQYLASKVDDFQVDSSFNRGGVFVASGTKKRDNSDPLLYDAQKPG